jgi:riboflavin kinase/FMN adenylyltransferase
VTLLAREELGRVAPGRESAVTIGVLDGVHRGHRYLIRELKARAAARSLASGVITFHPLPESVLRPETHVAYLTSLEERVELLRATGVDFVAPVTFTSELAELSARDFVAMLVEELQMRFMLTGPDFVLGRGREGTAAVREQLGEEMGFEHESLGPLLESNGVVSSTAVREALAAGEMEQVTRLLGRPFSLRGPVLRGADRGATIGFPTANIGLAPDRALPPFGVYVTAAYLPARRDSSQERQFMSVTNIGRRPTFGEQERTVEVHILDFEGDIYGWELRIDLLSRLRDEMRFGSAQELAAQIGKDVEAARRSFS